MVTNRDAWNPFDPWSWANFLGLVDVPAFGGASASQPGLHSVMLDGEAASFLMSVTDDSGFVFDESPLSWSWSANLRHLLVVNREAGEMFLRRWDAPAGSVRRFRLAKNPRAAFELLEILEKAPAPRAEDVILFALRAFRAVRNSLPSGDGLDSIRVFNLLLAGAEAVGRGQIPEEDWSRCRSVGDGIGCLPPNEVSLAELGGLPSRVTETTLDEALFRRFLLPEPTTGCRLNPELLLRHASGQLYQEAHLRLEREFRQAFFPGIASDAPTGGLLTKDVRFTPPALARALVEQSLTAISARIDSEQPPPLDILDPACGSGVFLQEALRELVKRNYAGAIKLRGFDTSPVSCAISRFCLERAKRDAPTAAVSLDIRQTDSLQEDWGTPDLILMNPPFVPWERMSAADQSAVGGELGPLRKFRADLAMAFIWKGVRALSPDASLATVLPAPLFETGSGERWRDAIKSRAELLLLGRFAGYGFFRGSTVEPGMLVVRGRGASPPREAAAVRILVAKSGCEDAAIRALRRVPERSPAPAEWDVFSVREQSLSSASWVPRFRSSMHLVENLAAAGVPRVSDLFHVHQGTLTGNNKVFVLSAAELSGLPRRERASFKPIASNSTICDGTISRDEFVFFPYDSSGRTIDTEEELANRVPQYYKGWLAPAKSDLATRGGIDRDHWWLLTRHRSWQLRRRPKLVSTYFGYRGSFAYDETG
jgi:hypothetical protein